MVLNKMYAPLITFCNFEQRVSNKECYVIRGNAIVYFIVSDFLIAMLFEQSSLLQLIVCILFVRIINRNDNEIKTINGCFIQTMLELLV